MSHIANFPEGFTDTPHYLAPHEVAAKFALPLTRLEAEGYGVIVGLRERDVYDLTRIASQEGSREYCPNDLRSRWTDIPSARNQLAKAGGRGVFRLVSLLQGHAPEDGRTVGYGWTGAASAKESALTKCDNTFAIRLDEILRGKRLALPFTQAILAGSMAVFGARNVGLETWASNGAAVRTYLSAGGIIKGLETGDRETLDSAHSYRTEPVIEPVGLHDNQVTHFTRDTRIYMQFPQTMR